MQILQGIISGIPQGALYGLTAFGIALIFKTTGVLNFAHGNSGMLATYVGLSVYLLTQNIIFSIIAAVTTGLLVGLVVERFLMRPLKNISSGAMLIVTLGLLMVIEGIVMVIWGVDYHRFPEIYMAAPIILFLENGVLVMPSNDIAITIISLAVMLALALFLRYTKLGIAIRARSEDEIGALVCGIDINNVDTIVWSVGIATIALVGVLAAPKTYIHPSMLINMQLYGITAGVLGGFSNLFGVILGGLILGILEKLVGVFISPDYQLSIILILIILVLLFKPSGLFAKEFEGRA
ncbi:MAG TPA: branched-chain amino acid ABC transporter permease [Defluviitoga tunisiensis]|nr:branched-chain amino acid ABC transporter permease [Defluviitoga tunisiensis]